MPAAWGLDLLIARRVDFRSRDSRTGLETNRHRSVFRRLDRRCRIECRTARQIRGPCRDALADIGIRGTPTAAVGFGRRVGERSGHEYRRKKSPTTAPTPGLNIEEGIHFDWHMERRHRAERMVRLFDETGRNLERRELHPEFTAPPEIVVTAGEEPPAYPRQRLGKRNRPSKASIGAGQKRYRLQRLGTIAAGCEYRPTSFCRAAGKVSKESKRDAFAGRGPRQ